MLTPAEWAALTLSVKVAVTATVVGLPIAIPVALLMARNDFPLKGLVDVLLHLPLVVPPVVVGYGLLLLLAPNSLIGGWLAAAGLSPAFSWQGAATASLVMALPLMVRAIRQAFEAIDPALLDTAATLGAEPLARVLTISLPLALPGILVAAVLGFARALGEFGATVTFAANIPGLTQTLPLALYSAAQTPGGEAPALRLAFLCLVPAVLSLLLSNTISKRLRARQGLAP